MKGFKKGLALIAVLAFLIMATLPAGVLAAGPQARVNVAPPVAADVTDTVYGESDAGTALDLSVIELDSDKTATTTAADPTASDIDAIEAFSCMVWAGNKFQIYADKPTAVTSDKEGTWHFSAPQPVAITGAAPFAPTALSQASCTMTGGGSDNSNKKLSEIAVNLLTGKGAGTANGAQAFNVEFTMPETSAGNGTNPGAYFVFVAYQDTDNNWYFPPQVYLTPVVANPKTLVGTTNVTGATADKLTFGAAISEWDVLKLDQASNEPATSATLTLTSQPPTKPTAPPFAGTSFMWSWSGPASGSELGSRVFGADITVPEAGTYKITCQKQSTTPAWIGSSKSDELTLTVNDGSGSTSGPQAQPDAIAIGQKTTLTASIPTSGITTGNGNAASIYAWAWNSNSSDTTNGLATLSSYVVLGTVPTSGEITNVAWPGTSTWFGLVDNEGGDANALPKPYPSVSVAQLFAVDETDVAPATPQTADEVKICAIAGTDVELKAEWGEAGNSWTGAAQKPNTVALRLTKNGQPVDNQATETNTITIAKDEVDPLAVELKYEGDKPAVGDVVNFYNSVMPYTAASASQIDGYLAPVQPVSAKYLITPSYLVTNDGNTVQELTGTAAPQLFKPKTLTVSFNRPTNYGPGIKDGTVSWEVTKAPVGVDTSTILSETTTTFGNVAGANSAWSQTHFTPPAMGLYSVTATASNGGSQATYQINVTEPFDPNCVLIQPGDNTAIPAEQGTVFTGTVIGNDGLPLPAGTELPGKWVVIDKVTNNEVGFDQVAWEQDPDDPLKVTVTPTVGVIGNSYYLRYEPEAGYKVDGQTIQSTRIEFTVREAEPEPVPGLTITMPSDPNLPEAAKPEVLVTQDVRTGATMGVITLPELTGALPDGVTATLKIEAAAQDGQTMTFDPAAAGGTLTYDPESKGWLAEGSSEPIKAVQLTGFNAPVKVTVTADGVTLTDPDGAETSDSAEISYEAGTLSLPGPITVA